MLHQANGLRIAERAAYREGTSWFARSLYSRCTINTITTASNADGGAVAAAAAAVTSCGNAGSVWAVGFYFIFYFAFAPFSVHWQFVPLRFRPTGMVVAKRPQLIGNIMWAISFLSEAFYGVITPRMWPTQAHGRERWHGVLYSELPIPLACSLARCLSLGDWIISNN